MMRHTSAEYSSQVLMCNLPAAMAVLGKGAMLDDREPKAVSGIPFLVFDRLTLFLYGILFTFLVAFLPNNTLAAISDIPLFTTTSSKANIVVILDNSNSMDEAPNGSAVGSNSSDSKSEIARTVIKDLIADYTGTINMGLMAYRQNALSAYYLHNSPYDVSYNPANYDPNYSGSRNSLTKRYRVLKPGSSSDYVYFNVALPFYAGSNQGNAFCYSPSAVFDNGSEVYPGGPWDTYRCFGTKTGTSDTIPTWNNTASESAAGYTGYFYQGQLSPTDSDLAQNILDFGKRLTWAYIGRTWFNNTSPGRGYLHIPIKDLNTAQASNLNTKLACNIPTTPAPCTNVGIPNAGLTPIEGTLLTAKDYFAGTWTNASEGYMASVYPLPNSCKKDFVILVTDGLPSTDKNGNTVTDPATSIAQAASAAAALKANGVETYVVGFALPVGTDPGTLNTVAISGGTTQAYLANDSATLKTALGAIFLDIKFKTGTAAAIATNSTRIDTSALIYQAKFDSSDWSGQMIAYKVNQDGSIDTVNLAGKAWDTDQIGKIPNYINRKIFTWNGTGTPLVKGVEFLWDNLAASQQSNLRAGGTVNDGKDRLNWLRGYQSKEKPSGVFRARSKILGDIVNSDPFYVAAPNFGYEALPGAEGSTYFTFRTGNLTRTKMLYVGANDGMLHAFDAQTGIENFAYIPKAVFPKLASLTAPNYAHQYFVDGSPYAGDAYFGGAWHTVLLGTTGAGERAVFALDVTAPDSFGASNVLWEFTDSDLGYTIGQPFIGRMNNGKWAAIFGNGYNSTSQRAFLYVVDLETGVLIRKIDTGAGSAGTPNGLATPALLADQNRIIEYAYAGDLLGNLWKFDLASATSGNWKVAYDDGATPPNPAPLFKARYVSGSPSVEVAQPITAPLEIGLHPNGGYLIVFGTGKYFEVGDNGSTAVQSLYGVWDKGARIVQTNRSTLERQTILAEPSASGLTWRVVSKNPINWGSRLGWYVDLVAPPYPPGTAQGERVVSMPILRNGRAILTTLIPSSDPCQYGGTSWIMEVDMVTGGRLDYSVFDVNNDTQFSDADNVSVAIGLVPVSGIQSSVGIIKTPGIISAGEVEYKYAGGSSGGIMNVREKGASDGGRQSWRQLR